MMGAGKVKTDLAAFGMLALASVGQAAPAMADGALGDGTTASKLSPEPIGLAGVTQVVMGSHFALRMYSAAVRSDGTRSVQCWIQLNVVGPTRCIGEPCLGRSYAGQVGEFVALVSAAWTDASPSLPRATREDPTGFPGLPPAGP